MTNEELVMLIQSGERERLEELWSAVEKFVSMQARKRTRQLRGRCGVTFDDLYQSGFLALAAAVDTYKPNKGANFIYWLDYHLKTAFAQTSGSYGNKANTLNDALDIDAPIPGTDDFTLADILEDPDAAQSLDDVGGMICREQLHNALETALSGLAADQADIIRRRFYKGQTITEIAAEKALPVQKVQQTEAAAMLRLRRPTATRKQLDELLRSLD